MTAKKTRESTKTTSVFSVSTVVNKQQEFGDNPER